MTDDAAPPPDRPARPARQSAARKQMLLRLDPAVHDALARWAADELRSANAQIEFLLRRALAEAGRLPRGTTPIARRGRPPKTPPPD
uniref:Toxin-antitoxin system HicB family antitoxin n=1 Tax=Streptomyces sp. NBC_01401 TaxID=2903854 RepID=A0AAU3GV42_9ACTN